MKLKNKTKLIFIFLVLIFLSSRVSFATELKEMQSKLAALEEDQRKLLGSFQEKKKDLEVMLQEKLASFSRSEKTAVEKERIDSLNAKLDELKESFHIQLKEIEDAKSEILQKEKDALAEKKPGRDPFAFVNSDIKLLKKEPKEIEKRMNASDLKVIEANKKQPNLVDKKVEVPSSRGERELTRFEKARAAKEAISEEIEANRLEMPLSAISAPSGEK